MTSNHLSVQRTQNAESQRIPRERTRAIVRGVFETMPKLRIQKYVGHRRTQRFERSQDSGTTIQNGATMTTDVGRHRRSSASGGFGEGQPPTLGQGCRGDDPRPAILLSQSVAINPTDESNPRRIVVANPLFDPWSLGTVPDQGDGEVRDSLTGNRNLFEEFDESFHGGLSTDGDY